MTMNAMNESDFIKHVQGKAENYFATRPTWMVMVPDADLMKKLTTPSGWQVHPVHNLIDKSVRMQFHQIAGTNLCFTQTPFNKIIVDSMLKHVIGTPTNFLLMEITPTRRAAADLISD